jgi:hypothetical protein
MVIWRGGASEELGDVGAGGGEGIADVAEDAGEVVVAVLVVGVLKSADSLGMIAHGKQGGGVFLGLVAVVG